MPSLTQDQWVNEQAAEYPISDLEDCAIAVEASYYLQLLLHLENEDGKSFEPLLPALGSITGMEKRIEDDLDQWEAHRITPFFVFDGQALVGQDEMSIVNGRSAHEQTNAAWRLYFNNQPSKAVTAFGASIGAIRAETLYSILQRILRKRNLHFLVAPYNAAAQIAYFDMIDSDQCGGIMGSDELLLYPINDCVIKSIDWGNTDKGEKVAPVVKAVSKRHLLLNLGGGVSEPLFVDALLARGTSFLPRFPGLPALLQPVDGKDDGRPPSIRDALNTLRTANKSVAVACSTFNDLIQAHDPLWLDKYQKALMAVKHFIYIAESGEIQVNDYENLTKDNHEYLGIQVPAELFHYLSTGLIGPRNLNCITHSRVVVLPTVDGYQSPEYERLVETQTRAIKEHALALITSGLHRGIQHKPITLKLWYNPDTEKASQISRAIQETAVSKVTKWTVKEAAIKEHLPQFSAGSIASELLALKNADFVQSTHTKAKAKGIDSADSIVSLTIWRFLHLREYVDDRHTLTKWGDALATAMEALKPTAEKNPGVGNLYEALLVAFELIRFDILNAKNKYAELNGYPMNGSEETKASLLLISRCASLLKLRHQQIGYTGPLSKNLLHFRTLASEVRLADRDLTEAIVASNFLHAQSKRQREDNFEISQRLPFLEDPHVALGIAVKTYFDDILPDFTREQKEEKKKAFVDPFLPYAVDFPGDLDIACSFFDAIYAGVKAVDAPEIPPKQREDWDKAADYLRIRR